MLSKILKKMGLGGPIAPAPDAVVENETTETNPRPEQPTATPAGEKSADAWSANSRSMNAGFTDAVKSGWYNVAAGELLEGFAIRPEDTVLDVGCGVGAATMFCANQGAHVIFSDLEQDKVNDLARRVAASPARGYDALVSDTDPLPLIDQHATRIIAMEMLEHTDRPQDILQELVRVGKPGALYLLTVPDPVGEKVQQGIAPREYFQAPNHIRIFERNEFVQVIEDAGLVVQRRTAYGFYWTMWMLFYWVTEAAAGTEFDGAVLDTIKPPHHPLLESWASIWQEMLRSPQGIALKDKLDELMPKGQVVIAQKPGSRDQAKHAV